MKGIDIKEVVEYVSVNDKDPNPTKFLLGVISNREKLALLSDAMNSDGTVDIKKIQSRAIDILKVALKGIKQLGSKDYDKITDEVIDMIPFDVIGELIGKICELNFLGDKEIKN